MEFKFSHLKQQFDSNLHPKVRALVDAFEAWSIEQGLPAPVVTHILRSDQEQIDIYYPYAIRLLRDGRAGKRIDPVEQSHLNSIRQFIRQHGDEMGPIMWALHRWTWHRVHCAVDLRNNHYTPTQLAQVNYWLKQAVRERQLGNEEWEYLMHDVGRGDHIHVGHKDRHVQAKFMQTWKPDLTKLRIPGRAA